MFSKTEKGVKGLFFNLSSANEKVPVEEMTVPK